MLKRALLVGWVLGAPLLARESAARTSSAVDARSISCGRAPKVADAQPAGDRSVGEKPKSGLPPEVIRAVVRKGFASFRSCYEASLRPCPNLQGRVTVDFTIQPKTGRVSTAKATSDLGSDALHRCVAGKFKELEFPTFEGEPLKVVYPIAFTPGE